MKRFLFFIVLFISILVVGTWWYLCPLLKSFPRPSGPFPVGVAAYHLVDKNRLEDATPSDKRELMVNILYPSDRDNKNMTFPYQPAKMAALATYRAQGSIIPGFVWRCLLGNIMDFAQPNALISSKKSSYPLIVFLPGIGGDNLYQVYLEDLASHGYIVVELEPAGDVPIVVFPDGRVVELRAQFRAAMEQNNRNQIYDYRTKAHYRWLHDIEFVVKKLEQINDEVASPFYQKLDLHNVGFMGHSHGGWVMADFCATHDMCKAGINLDGWTKTVNVTTPFTKDFLFLLNESGFDVAFEKQVNVMGPKAHIVKVPGADHTAFSDYILLKQPFAYLFGVATQDADEVRMRIAQHIRDFFDERLRGIEV